MNLSLRTRLVLGTVLLMVCGLLIADVAGLVLMRSFQLQRLDDQLSLPGKRPGSTDWRSNPVSICTFLAPSPGAAQQLPSAYAVVVFDQAGRVACRVPDRTGLYGAPDEAALPATRLAELARTAQAVTVPGTRPGPPWRVRVNGSSRGFVVVAASFADADATLRRMELIAAGVGLVIVALAGVGGWALVRLGLRPLAAIEVTAAAIASGDLSQRVATPSTNTEVGRLSASLNDMLTQIEHAFRERTATEQRLRQFVADAGHELRSPLATIRGHAELYRHGVATTPDDVARLLSRVESESIRMGALVEDLLLLARLDTAPRLQFQPVDLLTLAADTVVDARARDGSRSIVLSRSAADPEEDVAPVVRGDEAKLRQILSNLLSNALRHTPSGTPVEVQVGVRAATVRLLVIDHGPGLSEDAAARVFERFYRDDPGRARSAGGSGLGLSIVAGLVRAHRGSVHHEPTPGGGSTFVVVLPIEEPLPPGGRVDIDLSAEPQVRLA